MRFENSVAHKCENVFHFHGIGRERYPRDGIFGRERQPCSLHHADILLSLPRLILSLLLYNLIQFSFILFAGPGSGF